MGILLDRFEMQANLARQFGCTLRAGVLAAVSGIDNTCPDAIVCGLSNQRMQAVATAASAWTSRLADNCINGSSTENCRKDAMNIDDPGNYKSLQASITGRI